MIAIIDNNFVGRAIAFGFVALFASFVVNAIRRGAITPTKSDRAYLRTMDPGTFWFHVVAYAIIAASFLPGVMFAPRLTLLGFGMLFAYLTLNEVKIGRLKPSAYDRVYTRSDNPGTYWFHIVVQIVLVIALLAAAVWTA